MDKNELFKTLRICKVPKESVNFISAHSILFSLPLKLQNKIKKGFKMEKNTKEEIKHNLKMCFACVTFLCFLAISIIVLSRELKDRNWIIQKKWIDTYFSFIETKRLSEIEKIISFDDIIEANLLLTRSGKRRV